jgi:hypothetical protein
MDQTRQKHPERAVALPKVEKGTKVGKGTVINK